MQEDHPADHDVLGMEAEAPAFEDDRTGPRLPEVEAGREVHVEAQEARRAAHEVGVLVHAIRARLRTGRRRGERNAEQRAEAVHGPALFLVGKKRRGAEGGARGRGAAAPAPASPRSSSMSEATCKGV